GLGGGQGGGPSGGERVRRGAGEGDGVAVVKRGAAAGVGQCVGVGRVVAQRHRGRRADDRGARGALGPSDRVGARGSAVVGVSRRSEERRVGKERGGRRGVGHRRGLRPGGGQGAGPHGG